MTVACVLRRSPTYTPEWVDRLHAQVAEHLTPERFVCITDTVSQPMPFGTNGQLVPLRHGWPGWWAKMELFRPDVFTPGERVLYLDLDTLVVDDLSRLEAYDGDFAALEDFMEPGRPASGAMLWRTGAVDLYDRAVAAERFPPRYAGRSDYWWSQFYDPDPLQDLYPGMFGSYKVDDLEAGPDGFAVVCFHGDPKPHQLGGWVKEAWNV